MKFMKPNLYGSISFGPISFVVYPEMFFNQNGTIVWCVALLTRLRRKPFDLYCVFD